MISLFKMLIVLNFSILMSCQIFFAFFIQTAQLCYLMVNLLNSYTYTWRVWVGGRLSVTAIKSNTWNSSNWIRIHSVGMDGVELNRISFKPDEIKIAPPNQIGILQRRTAGALKIRNYRVFTNSIFTTQLKSFNTQILNVRLSRPPHIIWYSHKLSLCKCKIANYDSNKYQLIFSALSIELLFSPGQASLVQSIQALYVNTMCTWCDYS